MAITSTITPLQTFGPFTMSAGAYGAVSQGDGSYLAGYSTTIGSSPSSATSHWLQSVDRGATWAARGSANGIFGQGQRFPSNCRSNILLYPAFDPSTSDAFIYRSVDGGATFSVAYQEGVATSPNGRSVNIYGVQSYGRTNAIAWGELDGNNTNPPMIWGTSTDGGATWTPHASFDIGNFFDVGNAFGLAADGVWFLAYIKFGGSLRESYMGRTSNAGSTWTVAIRTRNTEGASFLNCEAIACIDAENILFGGHDTTSGSTSVPVLWWSDDACTTVNLVDASDVTNWPAGAFTTSTREVKRLTRDAAFWAFEMQNGASGCPYRISLDKGHTWPIEPTRSTGSWKNYTIPLGKTVVTRRGKILSMALESDDYVAGNVTIYGTEIHC